MFYPIHVHKEEHSAYGASFPDFPDCFAAADELQDLPKAAQEAVQAHFFGDSSSIPAPTTPESWSWHDDYKDGFWTMVDIDLSKVNNKAIRLNISLPESLVHRIDAVAKAQHLSRSAFLAKAAEREIANV